MNVIKRILIFTLLFSTTGQLICGDTLWSWSGLRDYFSSWNSAALANAARSTGTWIKENPGNTTAFFGGLTAAGVACYLYKRSCTAQKEGLSKPPESQSSIITTKRQKTLQEADQFTLISDVIIYKWDGNERDLKDIETEVNKDENFKLLGLIPDSQKPGNLRDILNSYLKQSNGIINIIRKKNANQDFVGFIAFNTEGYIGLFLIRDIFRGPPNKYAELIINNTFDILKKLGINHATLNTKTSNERARKFYERLGFERLYEREPLSYYTKWF